MLALLIAHFNELVCIKLWLKSGTSAKPNYLCSYNLRDICHFPRGYVQHYTIPLYHTMRSLNVMPCPILLAMERDQLGFCSNPDLLANLGKGDFHDETYSSYPISSSAGCSIFPMRAAVIMCGWLCLASAEYPKHCHLSTSNAPQLHIQRAHYQSMVRIQAACNIPLLPPQPDTMGWSKGKGTLVPTVMPLAPMCRSYHADAPNDAYPGNVVAKTQTRTAQNRANTEPVTCMNN